MTGLSCHADPLLERTHAHARAATHRLGHGGKAAITRPQCSSDFPRTRRATRTRPFSPDRHRQGAASWSPTDRQRHGRRYFAASSSRARQDAETIAESASAQVDQSAGAVAVHDDVRQAKVAVDEIALVVRRDMRRNLGIRVFDFASTRSAERPSVHEPVPQAPLCHACRASDHQFVVIEKPSTAKVASIPPVDTSSTP